MATDTLTAQIKGLEAQLAVLKARVSRAAERESAAGFATLYGLLSGKARSTEAEIKAAEYRMPWETASK
jgi:hypothetical protein